MVTDPRKMTVLFTTFLGNMSRVMKIEMYLSTIEDQKVIANIFPPFYMGAFIQRWRCLHQVRTFAFHAM